MAALDIWDKTPDEQTFGRAGALITPSDTEELAEVSKGLYVLTAGTVSFIPVDSSVALTTGSLTAGSVIPFFVQQVRSTGTTATVASIR